MSDVRLTADERDALRDELVANGASPGSGIHGWRCNSPEQYGPCTCLDEMTDDVTAAVEAIIAARLARVEALATEFDSSVDWSAGRNNYGDNEAWESAARQLRAALGPEAPRTERTP